VIRSVFIYILIFTRYSADRCFSRTAIWDRTGWKTWGERARRWWKPRSAQYLWCTDNSRRLSLRACTCITWLLHVLRGADARDCAEMCVYTRRSNKSTWFLRKKDRIVRP